MWLRWTAAVGIIVSCSISSSMAACYNGGTRIEAGNGLESRCKCPTGFAGRSCEVRLGSMSAAHSVERSDASPPLEAMLSGGPIVDLSFGAFPQALPRFRSKRSSGFQPIEPDPLPQPAIPPAPAAAEPVGQDSPASESEVGSELVDRKSTGIQQQVLSPRGTGAEAVAVGEQERQGQESLGQDYDSIEQQQDHDQDQEQEYDAIAGVSSNLVSVGSDPANTDAVGSSLEAGLAEPSGGVGAAAGEGQQPGDQGASHDGDCMGRAEPPTGCPGSQSWDPAGCQCTCPLAYMESGGAADAADGVVGGSGSGPACLHGGTLDPINCECQCPPGRTGPRCDECPRQDCAHGGTWDSEYCRCSCPVPWRWEDHCATCPVRRCQNGGTFDSESCRCACSGLWEGEDCGTCQPLEALALRGGLAGAAQCGAKGFDRLLCACREQCPPRDCQHGGVQDPESCECVCNAGQRGHWGHAAGAVSTVKAGADMNVHIGGVAVPEKDQSVLSDQSSTGNNAAGSLLLQQAPSEASIRGAGAGAGAGGASAGASDSQLALLLASLGAGPGNKGSEGRGHVLLYSASRDPSVGSRGIALPERVMPSVAVSIGAAPQGTRTGNKDGLVRTFWSGDRCELCEAPSDVVPAGAAALKVLGAAGNSELATSSGAHGDALSSPSYLLLSLWGARGGSSVGSGRVMGQGQAFVAPRSCPPFHVFDHQACGCRPACPTDMCKNGGEPVMLVGKGATGASQGAFGAAVAGAGASSSSFSGNKQQPQCGCRCPVPWSGSTCEVRGSGSNPASSARSCLAVKRLRPEAPSGLYWVNPSGVDPLRNAIEVHCDMEGDGGGWLRLANVGPALAARMLDGNTYTQGTLARRGTEWVLPCTRLAGMDGASAALSVRDAEVATTPEDAQPASPRRFVLRVTMGEAVDYFRPLGWRREGNGTELLDQTHSSHPTLCEVLRSHGLHEWAGRFRRDMVGGHLTKQDAAALGHQGTAEYRASDADESTGEDGQSQDEYEKEEEEEKGTSDTSESENESESEGEQGGGDEEEEGSADATMATTAATSGQSSQEGGAEAAEMEATDGGPSREEDQNSGEYQAEGAGTEARFASRRSVLDSQQYYQQQQQQYYQQAPTMGVDGQATQADNIAWGYPYTQAYQQQLQALYLQYMQQQYLYQQQQGQQFPIQTGWYAGGDMRFAGAGEGAGAGAAPGAASPTDPTEAQAQAQAQAYMQMQMQQQLAMMAASYPGQQQQQMQQQQAADQARFMQAPQGNAPGIAPGMLPPIAGMVAIPQQAQRQQQQQQQQLPAIQDMQRFREVSPPIGAPPAPAVPVPPHMGQAQRHAQGQGQGQGQGRAVQALLQSSSSSTSSSSVDAAEAAGHSSHGRRLKSIKWSGLVGSGGVQGTMQPGAAGPVSTQSQAATASVRRSGRDMRLMRAEDGVASEHLAEGSSGFESDTESESESKFGPGGSAGSTIRPRTISAAKAALGVRVPEEGKKDTNSTRHTDDSKKQASAGQLPRFASARGPSLGPIVPLSWPALESDGSEQDQEQEWEQEQEHPSYGGGDSGEEDESEQLLGATIAIDTPDSPMPGLAPSSASASTSTSGGQGGRSVGAAPLALAPPNVPMDTPAEARAAESAAQASILALQQQQQQQQQQNHQVGETGGAAEAGGHEAGAALLLQSSADSPNRLEDPNSAWTAPAYVDTVLNPQLSGVLGGSRKNWPLGVDGRMYLPFWGGNRGGCCHQKKGGSIARYAQDGEGGSVQADEGKWGLQFAVDVIEVDAELYESGEDFAFGEHLHGQQAHREQESNENDPMNRV